MTRLTALVVEPDAGIAEAFRDAARREPGVSVHLAGSAADGLTAARWIPPDLLVIGAPADATAADVSRSVRGLPGVSVTMTVLLAGVPASDPDPVEEAGEPAVDTVLPRPPGSAEVIRLVRLARRLKGLRARIKTDTQELTRLRDVVGRGVQQVLPLIERLVALSVPGARERSERVADLSAKVAARFGVPARLLPDLEVAARLQEIGRLPVLEDTGTATPDDPRHYVVFSRGLLDQVDALKGAAEVVGAVFENWDGTGFPGHLLSGQIPLRSRILRVVSDYVHGCGGSSAEATLAAMQERAGSSYDPVVLVHLAAVLLQPGTGGGRGPAVVAVNALQPGMVLAEDLCTDGGLKLLARDTVLTASILEMIRRRHQLEPIVQGAAVHPAGPS